MRFSIGLFLLFPLCAFAAVTPAITATMAANTAVIAANNAAAASAVQSEEQALLAHVKSSVIQGVMACEAYYIDVNAPSAYDMTGCKTRGEHLGINQFFKKFKRKREHEIIQVIYNDHKNMFLIYYGRRYSVTGNNNLTSNNRP